MEPLVRYQMSHGFGFRMLRTSESSMLSPVSSDRVPMWMNVRRFSSSWTATTIRQYTPERIMSMRMIAIGSSCFNA
ncbi:MAG: hypothetical protein BWY82_01277 [Verrucomicrobia bacterium ADurb.Bin474]|nr:MAG: hypothetical protein BWY82_01277 [Verrucomicrobia bacterium ADurb.Bin474]